MKLASVGIKNIRYPVQVEEKAGSRQQTVATVCLSAAMPSSRHDTCAASLLEVLHRYQAQMSVRIFSRLLEEVRERLAAQSAQLAMSFPYFLTKEAPVSGTRSLMEYRCAFTGTVGDQTRDFVLGVWAPITTLCPCSKEISQFGAHNQRGEVNLNVRFRRRFLWAEDLIALVERAASAPVFALLKRPDEKYVTEAAYRNPMFVEDVVRRVAELASGLPEIAWFSVGVESFESIHKHSAYAFLEGTPEPKERTAEGPTRNFEGRRDR
ncbi:MAG: GTP cyclohydrolase FolE2 [Thermodesulfobacteriota bacterium]